MLPKRLQKYLQLPQTTDDKYSRGVEGFVTGSNAYPGAAILGVTAAIRTGIGMVRYFGPESWVPFWRLTMTISMRQM